MSELTPDPFPGCSGNRQNLQDFQRKLEGETSVIVAQGKGKFVFQP